MDVVSVDELKCICDKAKEVTLCTKSDAMNKLLYTITEATVNYIFESITIFDVETGEIKHNGC